MLLSANASDNVALARVDFLVDGNVVATASKPPYTADWISSAVPDGVHTISARAVDTSGNVAESPVSVNVDNTPPTSAATAPAFSNNDTFNVAYTASDTASGIEQVNLYAKGPTDTQYNVVSEITTTSTSGNISFLATEGDGTYSFYTRAIDGAGNVEPVHATPDSSTVVDTAAPTSSASAPAFAGAGPWSIGYTAASSPAGVAEVDLYAKGPSDTKYTKVAADTSGAASGAFSYTAAEGDGSYSFYTVATDKAGNVEAAPATADATTLRDTVPPTSSASAPAASNPGTVTVSWTASDNAGGSGLAEVDLYAKGPTDSGYSQVASDTSGSASGSFGYAFAEGIGTYSFYTVATDKAGQRGERGRQVRMPGNATTVIDLVGAVVVGEFAGVLEFGFAVCVLHGVG